MDDRTPSSGRSLAAVLSLACLVALGMSLRAPVRSRPGPKLEADPPDGPAVSVRPPAPAARQARLIRKIRLSVSETREALHACRRRERQLAREVATIERMLENDALARRAGCLEERGSITALQVMLRETETASSASESLRGLLQARLRRRLGLLRDELQAHRRQTSARIRSLEMELGSSSETVSRLHRQMRASLDS